MKYEYTKTSLWKNFSCVGGECINTCCAGWKIPFLSEDMERFSQLPEQDRNSLLKEIDGETGYARMKDGRCPFLTGDNLCRIILGYSSEYIGTVCSVFPRNVTRFGNCAGRTVSCSCPYVAVDVFYGERIGFFVETKETGEDNFDAEDECCFAFQKLRDFLIGSLQSADGYVAGKIWLLLEFVKDVSALLSTGELTLDKAEALAEEYAGQRERIFCDSEKAANDAFRRDEAFLFYAKVYRDAINRKTVETYSPKLYHDMDFWQEHLQDLHGDLEKFSDFLRRNCPSGAENFLVNGVFMKWEMADPEEFIAGIFAYLAELVVIQMCALSVLRHGGHIFKEHYAGIVSSVDRDCSHNDAVRAKMAEPMLAACGNAAHPPWMFPFG